MKQHVCVSMALIVVVTAAACTRQAAPVTSSMLAGEPGATTPRRAQPPRFIHIAALSDPSLLPDQPPLDDERCDSLCRAYAEAAHGTRGQWP